VEPAELEFTKVNERKTFTVTVSAAAGASSEQELAEGTLSWLSHDLDHVVRSPIVADSRLTLS
jgi:hypothetical protein